MTRREGSHKTLNIQSGVTQPPNVNPDVISSRLKRKRKKYSSDEYVAGIFSGNKTILSQAITLVESTLPEDYEAAQEIIERCLHQRTDSIRIGITGIPGAGKSTFIETFGLYASSIGRKLAILAIDPSSGHTRGSILGDKTRMEKLSVHPEAFIRPSPSAGTLGGVARKTKETIILCEAAGFDTIIVETVGVGQSETAVRTMVDFFLLLMVAGAGDELQGIKRGIMEMADAVSVTKADGDNIASAERTRVTFQNAMNLFPLPQSGLRPAVVTCSALNNNGIKELWETVTGYIEFTRKSGYFDSNRKQQEIIRMHDSISESLLNSFYNNRNVSQLLPEIEKLLYEGTITSYKAALRLLEKYHEK
jgi:LAO/AO transport system kinase